MALTDKNIVITSNVGAVADPQIVFSGASSILGPQNITLRAYPTADGTLSFEGSAGQLFSITNSQGVGISEDLNIGGNLYVNGTNLYFGTPSANTGIVLRATDAFPYSVGFDSPTKYMSVGPLVLGAGDFTVEGWFNISAFTDSGGDALWSQGSSDALSGIMLWVSPTFYRIYAETIPQINITTTVPALNTWTHYAVVRNGTAITLYINGTSIGAYSSSRNFDNPTFFINRGLGGLQRGPAGYQSNFRVTNTAVYTTNFTVPTSPLTAISGTQLLTLNAATIVDSSVNAYTLTNFSGVVSTSVTPGQAGIVNWVYDGSANWNSSVGIRVQAITASTSTTTGAIIVAGGVGVSGNLNIGGDANVIGTVNATDLNSTSDITLKENIQSIVDAWSIIKQLDPVSFNWKNNGKIAYGLIAQEIEKLLPTLVGSNDQGNKTVSYIQLIPFLIAIIQQQQADIAEIKKQINT